MAALSREQALINLVEGTILVISGDFERFNSTF